MRGWVTVTVSLVLMIVLSACSVWGEPGRAVVKQAIALQVQQDQQVLVDQLYTQPTTPPKVNISYVRIQSRKPLVIEEQVGYQVKGTCMVLLQFPGFKRLISRNTPFEVYVQQETGTELWSLARPLSSEWDSAADWQVIPLPLLEAQVAETT